MSNSEISYSSQYLDSVKLSQEEVDGLSDIETNQFGLSNNFAFKETVVDNKTMPDGVYLVTIQIAYNELEEKYNVNKTYRLIIVEQ